jgi:hypothetical protein
MIGQRLWRGRLVVALTAVAVTAGTALAGGAAHAAEPGSPDFAAVGKEAQARMAKLRGQTAVAGKRLATDPLTFGDLDGDAKADLAAIDSLGRFWVYPGKATVYSGAGPRPTSHFGARFQAGSGWSRFTAIVRHGDWNNDGLQDLLGRDNQGRLFFYAGTGTRPNVVRNGVQVGSGWNVFGEIVGVGDTDGDGLDDLVGRRTNGTLTVYYGNGNGFSPFRRQTATYGSGWNGDLLTTIGDWDNDGHTEYLFRTLRDEVYLYWSAANGLPSNRRALIFEAEGGAYVQNIVGMGNLTSDAVIDGQPVTQPLPDVLVQDTSGYLLALAVDTGDDFDVVVGTGWASYFTF